jgi:hypothetical protein
MMLATAIHGEGMHWALNVQQYIMFAPNMRSLTSQRGQCGHFCGKTILAGMSDYVFCMLGSPKLGHIAGTCAMGATPLF